MDNTKFDLLNNQNEREIIMAEERLDLLDKVKEVVFMKGTEYMTTKMVADYYEVGLEAIKSIIKRHKEELTQNGYKLVSGKELKEILVRSNMDLTNKRGYFECNGEKFANNSNGLFNKRSILNIGMLLEESSIAEQVRTLLLDNHEQLNNINKKLDNGEEITKEDIDKSDPLYFVKREKELKQQELEIAERLAKSIINGDMASCMSISCEMSKIKDDLVDLEKERNELLVHSNKTYTASELATECGFRSARAFNKDLEERKIQYKVNGTWKLYSEYDGKGYTETKQTEINGTTIYNTRWTGKGRKFLLENVYNNNKTA